MIIFGAGKKSIDCNISHTLYCPTCLAFKDFDLLADYEYFHLYFIFRIALTKKYSLVCRRCNNGWVHDAQSVESKLGRSPIPFMDQYGLLILIGGAFGAITISMLIISIL
ncbi:MAG: zinc-ribbon domain-containing protein [Acidobacteria bacterium]|nr:zinc-ribbon domain-containing protein [Acidobacteriota bacterium]